MIWMAHSSNLPELLIFVVFQPKKGDSFFAAAVFSSLFLNIGRWKELYAVVGEGEITLGSGDGKK